MTINERILALRRAAGLSQEALAEQVGVSRQAIGKWESGASLPGLDNLQELAHALDVSCDELLTGEAPGKSEPEATGGGVALESVKALLDAQSAAGAHSARRQRALFAGLAAALVCVGAALVYLGIYYGGRMRELSGRVDGIGSDVAGIDSRIDGRISAIQSSIEESLRQQASIVAGFDWKYGAPDTARRVPLTLTATPKNYRDGVSAVFTLTPGDGAPLSAAGTLLADNVFRAQLEIPLEMAYQAFTVSVGFMLDGETQTEELFREYNFVSGYQTTATVTPTDFKAYSSGRRTDGTAGITLGGDFEFFVERAYQENAALPSSAVVELVIDGAAVQRQEMDLAADFQPADGFGTSDGQAEAIFSGITYYLSFPEEVYAAPQKDAELVVAVTDSSGLTVTARQNVYRVD